MTRSGATQISEGDTGDTPNHADPLLGTLLAGRFRLASLIGAGGMGSVYRAIEEASGRVVAAKILFTGQIPFEDREVFEQRFFLEAKICAKIQHANVVKVYDHGRLSDDTCFIIMEYLEGRSLLDFVLAEGPISQRKTMELLLPLAYGLRTAHAAGAVHRDLKPANIMLTRDGDVEIPKVIDFGLAKELGRSGKNLTKTGAVMGTPKYMAPEQVLGESIDARTDIYALGIITFVMLTQRPPFAKTTAATTLLAQVHEAPPRIADFAPFNPVSSAFELIIRKALAKNPSDRFESMSELVGALDRLGDGTFDESEITDTFANQSAASGQFLGLADAEKTVFSPETGRKPSRVSSSSRRRTLVVGVFLCSTIGAALAALSPSSWSPLTDSSLAATDHPVQPISGEGSGAAAAPPTGSNGQAVPHSQGPNGTTSAEAFSLGIDLKSDPPGAMVTIGADTFGPTPTLAELKSSRPWTGQTVQAVFNLPGHQPFTTIRVVSRLQLRLTAKLSPIPKLDTNRESPPSAGRRSRQRAHRSPTRTPSTPPPRTSSGYRPSPY